MPEAHARDAREPWLNDLTSRRYRRRPSETGPALLTHMRQMAGDKAGATLVHGRDDYGRLEQASRLEADKSPAATAGHTDPSAKGLYGETGQAEYRSE